MTNVLFSPLIVLAVLACIGLIFAVCPPGDAAASVTAYQEVADDGPPTEPRVPEYSKTVRIHQDDAKAFFDLIMASDPTPVDELTDSRVRRLADDVARAFGHDSWIVGFHEMGERPDPQVATV